MCQKTSLMFFYHRMILLWRCLLRVLSFVSLLGFLQGVIETIKDPRQPSNGTKYTVKDAMLSAFSAFFMQCESFLEHQRLLQAQQGRDNAQNIFEVEKIPSDNQIRNILDEIAANKAVSRI